MNLIRLIFNLFKRKPKLTLVKPIPSEQTSSLSPPFMGGPPKACLDLIKKYEGFSPGPYLCPAGVPTIGYGTTYYEDGRLVTMKDPYITLGRAEDLLAHHVAHFYEQVQLVFKGVELKPNQLSALTSFCYNLGVGALLKSTLLKIIKTDPKDIRIPNEFKKWVKAGGQTLPGLVRRRKEEADLYIS